MKRFIALVISIVMIFALVGCNSNTEPNNEGTQNTQGNNTQTQDTQNTTENTNTGAFSGEVTESVVRNYKVTSEDQFVYTEQEGGVRVSGYTGPEKIVIPCISVAGITTITFPEGGGQGQFDFSSITLKDIADLKDFKTKIWDKGGELFDGGNIDSSVLEKINTPVEINIAVPDIHVPQINIPIVRAA